MAHYPLFVITTVPWTPASESPGQQKSAREAAQEAWGVLFQHISAPENREARCQPRTLSMGGEQYRYIRGQPPLEGTPSGTAPAGGGRGGWPQTRHHLWSARTNLKGDAAQAPDDVLTDSWNTTHHLVRLALQSHHTPQPVYPALLMEPDGTLIHQFQSGQEDVFGDEQPGDDRRGGTASLYVQDHPEMAWHMAHAPLRSIAQAQFRARYLQTMDRHPRRIVVGFDWEM